MTRLVCSLTLALLLSLVLAGLTFSAANQSPPSGSPTALVAPIWLGNPVAGEAYSARHIWDLQAWRGRVYLGYGDWYANLGPVDVWYYTPVTSRFLSETVYVSSTRPAARVDEEAIDRYVVIGGELYIPGIDPHPPDNWDWGNFYRNDGTGWVKYRTIPSGVHSLDMAGYEGELFAVISSPDNESLLRSVDEGLTWTSAISEADDPRFYELYEQAGALFAVRAGTEVYSRPMVYRYQAPWFVSTTIDLVPGQSDDWVFIYGEVHAFGDTVLYVPGFRNSVITCPRPMTALYQAQPGQNGQPLPFFDGKHPRDIVVAGGQVYVLDAGTPRCIHDSTPPDPAGYAVTIYTSTDLATWVPVATAHFADTPDALEVLDGRVYVGTYNGDVYVLPSHRFYLPLIIHEAIP